MVHHDSWANSVHHLLAVGIYKFQPKLGCGLLKSIQLLYCCDHVYTSSKLFRPPITSVALKKASKQVSVLYFILLPPFYAQQFFKRQEHKHLCYISFYCHLLQQFLNWQVTKYLCYISFYYYILSTKRFL